MKRVKTGIAGRSGIWLALFAMSAAAVLAIWMQNERTSSAGKDSTQKLEADVAKLWGWADPVVQGGSDGAVWSVRWDGQADLQEAKSLIQKLHLRNIQPGSADTLTSSENPAFRAELQRQGGTLMVWMQNGAAAGQTTCIVIYNGTAGQTKKELLGTIREVEQSLQSIASGAGYQASFSFRGNAADPEAPDGIVQAAEAEPRERYEDDGTVSQAYYTPELQTATVSAGKSVNLQIALHRNTGDGTDELAVGVPLITGDYSKE